LGSRQVEVDVTGRMFIGPLAPNSPIGGSPASDAVRLHHNEGPDGLAGIRWVMVDEDAPFTGWVAQLRAFQDTGAPAAPNVEAGFSAVRLTYQAPATIGSELDTLTLRGGRVGIGTTAPAAALNVASSTQGFLPPRMTTEQRDAIQAPQLP